MAVKRYDGSAWQTVAGLGAQGPAATSSSIATWVKTATGGETSVSGNDDNSQPLSYTVGQELVFINGALQKRGADYTATTGNSITGLTALAANDVVTVWTVNAFSVTNAISNTIMDAKGDLLTASGADVPAKLTVGNNGETLVADSSTTTGLRWQGNFAAGKNAIINGDFRINQRGFTSTTTSGTYGMDRWRFVAAGGTTTFSIQAFTPGTAPVAGYEGTNFARLVTTSQSASSDRAFFQQRIESVRTFANQTATFSFWAKAASGTPKMMVNLTQVFGTGGSAAAGVASATQNISTSWTRYSFTLAVPSISGKTIAGGDDHLALNIYVSDGGDYGTGVGAQNNTFDIWGVQAEAGSVATPFTTATGTLAGELAACQRYYWRTTGQAANANDLCVAYSKSTTSAEGVIRFPVTMRTAATGFFSAAGDFSFVWSAGVSTITGANIDRISSESIYLRLTTTGLTTGQGGAIYLGTGTTKWLEASAEL